MNKRFNRVNKNIQKYLFSVLFLCMMTSGCKIKKGAEKNTAKTGEDKKITQLQPVEVESMVDNSSVTVGDIINYSLYIKAIGQITPQIPEMGAKISGLRIIDMGAEGPREENGTRVWKKWYKLQADITGSYIIPPAQVVYQDPNGKQREVVAPQIYIEVKSVIKEGEEPGDIRDIKPPQKIETHIASIYILIGTIIPIFILIGGGIWLYVYKKRKKPEEEQRSPEEIALMELENLKSSRYLEQEDFRAFYFRLSEIFRAYMEERFGFPAQESTTEELIPQIESLPLTRAQKDTVRLLSSGEDLVKFARHRPTAEKALDDWEETRRLIGATSERHEANGEMR